MPVSKAIGSAPASHIGLRDRTIDVTRRRLLKGALLAGTALASAAFADAPPLIAAQEGDAAKIVAGFMARFAVPGMSVAIAQQGTIVYERGFGFADTDRREAVQPDHVFRIASVSKPITSCAIFDLIERGRLTLDARVFGTGSILGTAYGCSPYGRYIEDITIEHLLTHTSGGWSNDGNDPMFRYPALSHAELIAKILDSVALNAAPGTRYAYSNFGYCVLGRVIEKISNRSYTEHVQQAILAPCGVQRMTLAGNLRTERAPREVVYYGDPNEDPYGMNVRRMDAHDGWLASARDLTRFAVHVDGFATPRDILGADAIHVMTTPSSSNPSYAKGWAVNRANNWWHMGSLPGTMSILARTSGGFCWAALVNTRRSSSDMGAALDDLMWSIKRAVAG